LGARIGFPDSVMVTQRPLEPDIAILSKPLISLTIASKPLISLCKVNFISVCLSALFCAYLQRKVTQSHTRHGCGVAMMARARW